MLTAIEEWYSASNLHIDISKKEEEASQQLNRMFMSDGLRGMLEEREYRRLNMILFSCSSPEQGHCYVETRDDDEWACIVLRPVAQGVHGFGKCVLDEI